MRSICERDDSITATACSSILDSRSASSVIVFAVRHPVYMHFFTAGIALCDKVFCREVFAMQEIVVAEAVDAEGNAVEGGCADSCEREHIEE